MPKNKSPKIFSFIFGTRPEIIKIAPLIHDAVKKKIPIELIHTGQHFDSEMKAIILQQLQFPALDLEITLEQTHPVSQIGEMLQKIATYYKAHNTKLARIIVVQGDTNSALVGALVANKMDWELSHVEAGFRSGVKKQPEEINRILIDRLADYNFAVDTQCLKHLKQDGLVKTSKLMENPLFYTCSWIEKHLQPSHTNLFQLKKHAYILVTLHRVETVDDESTFKKITLLLEHVALKKSVLWVMHPRVIKNLQKTAWGREFYNKYVMPVVPQLMLTRLYLIAPQDYISFLMLLKNSHLIISDSGGVVLESVWYQKKLIILREKTEYIQEVKKKLVCLLSPRLEINQLIKKITSFDRLIFKTQKIKLKKLTFFEQHKI